MRLLDESEAWAGRRDLLEYRIREISDAGISADEDRNLKIEVARLENAEKLRELAAALEHILYEGDSSAAEQLGLSSKLAEEMATADSTAGSFVEQINDLTYRAEHLSRFFSGYGQDVEHDSAVLNRAAERLHLINRLKKKYGDTLSEVLAYCDKAEKELAEGASAEEEVERLKKEIKEKKPCSLQNA